MFEPTCTRIYWKLLRSMLRSRHPFAINTATSSEILIFFIVLSSWFQGVFSFYFLVNHRIWLYFHHAPCDYNSIVKMSLGKFYGLLLFSLVTSLDMFQFSALVAGWLKCYHLCRFEFSIKNTQHPYCRFYKMLSLYWLVSGLTIYVLYGSLFRKHGFKEYFICEFHKMVNF